MSEIKCSRCGTTMGDFGLQKLRLGGSNGYWDLFIHDIADVDVWTLQVHFYICPKCGKIELEAIQPEKILLSRQGVKKCVSCGEKIPLASEECRFCGAKQPEWK